MSKSYGNTIALTEEASEVERKIRTMPTDTQRVRLTDVGDPAKCPVWQLHQIYSDDEIKTWASEGCRTAGIGCVDCKQPIIDAVQAELDPIRERANDYKNDRQQLKAILHDGSEAAREIARETLDDVVKSMRFAYET
jgi:tryptophanyl-tRNA synthetase